MDTGRGSGRRVPDAYAQEIDLPRVGLFSAADSGGNAELHGNGRYPVSCSVSCDRARSI